MDPKPSSRRPEDFWIPAALFLAGAFYLIYFSRFNFKIADEGIPLNGALRVLRGEAPWVDFHGYAPGRYWLYALIFKWRGIDLMAVREVIAVLTAGAATLVFIACRWIMPLPFALMAAVLYLAAPGVYYGRFLSLFLALSMLPMAAACRGARWAPFACGAVAGLASIFRQDAGYVLICAPILIFIVGGWLKGELARARRPVVLCLLGAAAFWIPLIISMFATGIFWKILEIHNRFALGGYQKLNLPFPSLESGPFREWMLFYGPAATMAITGIYLLSRAWKKAIDPRTLFLGYLFVAGAGLFNQAIWRTQPENTFKVMLPILIFYCYFAGRVWWRFEGRAMRTAVLCAVLVLPTVFVRVMTEHYPFFLASGGYTTRGYRILNIDRAQVYAQEAEAVTFNEMTRYVRQTTRAEDTIYVAPFMGLPIYYLADRRNPTFFEWILPPEPVTFTDIEERVEADLEKAQTPLIIHYDFALDDREERRFKNYAPHLHRYIFNHYYLDRAIENYWMMRRGPSNIAALQQQTNSGTDMLQPGHSFGQTFLSEKAGLNEIKVRIATRAMEINGQLTLHLRELDRPGEDIRAVTVSFRETILGEWLPFRFAEIPDSAGKRYAFFVETSGDPAVNPVALAKFKSDNYAEGAMTMDHHPAEGDLSFVALSARGDPS